MKVWQKGMDIVERIYTIARQLPDEERFGLKSQITRASVSIPSNIAEGSAKTSSKEYKWYLEVALGSSYELETQMLIIEKLKMGEKEQTSSLLTMIDEEQKILQAFINRIGE